MNQKGRRLFCFEQNPYAAMKNKSVFTFLLLALLITAAVSHLNAGENHRHAYLIYDRDGQPATYDQMLEASAGVDFVLFGELHNNPIAHWLQLELSIDLHHKKGDQLVLAAEMFEADNQLILDEYLSGLITERNFRAEARLWNNYETDYRPLVELARENGLRFIASNIPRRYASVVHRSGVEGLEVLSEQARAWIAPLPPAYDPELPGYKAMLEMTGMPAHGNENFPKAQAIKDATMAHFSYQAWAPGKLLLHFHGAYHSNNYEGIYWYLREKNEKLRIVTISTVEQDDIRSLEQQHHRLADFIIAVPSRMTKTY